MSNETRVVTARIAQLSEARDLARAERDQALSRCRELAARLERALDANWRLGRVDLPRVADERDKAIRERNELQSQLSQADAEADADNRQRAIESLSRNLEAETQRADRAERERDDARRRTCCQLTHIDPSRQIGKLERIALRQVANENWGPGEGRRLFPEEP